MKKSQFTEVQVVQALQKHESGVATGVICREMGIAPATLSKWMGNYGGLDVSDVQKLRTLEEEHSRLKRMYINSEPSMSWTIVHEKLWPLRSILHCPPNA